MRLALHRQTLTTVLVFMLALFPCVSSYADSTKESLVKAIFVSKFIHYAQWPEPKSLKKKQPNTIDICVLGRADNTIVEALLKKATKKSKGLHNYRFKEKYNWAGVGVDCHILYIGAGQKKNLPQLIEDLKDQPVLTVSDVKGFAGLGGMIEFTTVKKKLKVGYVNVKTSKRAGIKIKSALLEVALNVIR